jgi:hypothetical protein
MIRNKVSMELDLANKAVEYEAKLKIDRLKMLFEREKEAMRLRSERKSQCEKRMIVTALTENCEKQADKIEVFAKELKALVTLDSEIIVDVDDIRK